jgi:hypothetical protein
MYSTGTVDLHCYRWYGNKSNLRFGFTFQARARTLGPFSPSFNINQARCGTGIVLKNLDLLLFIYVAGCFQCTDVF